MIDSKKQTIRGMNTASLDEMFYTLFMKAQLAESEDDIKNDRVMTLEELDKEMEELYESYNISQSSKRHARNF